MRQYRENIVTSQADSTALTASVTATSILHPAARQKLPGGSLADLTRYIAIEAQGRISNVVTTPGTLTLDVRLGGIIVFTGGAIPLNVVAKTNVAWRLNLLLAMRSVGIGTTATLIGEGVFISESVVGAAAGTALPCMLPAATPVVGNGFDSTADLILDLFGTWSISNANSIQTHQYIADFVNQ